MVSLLTLRMVLKICLPFASLCFVFLLFSDGPAFFRHNVVYICALRLAAEFPREALCCKVWEFESASL